ncbi:MAG TPA: hypothetical protein ENJ09_01285 [Planctomycetes bacterium]|nr:hypothetical protein [Planctomycetota bacterium]
MSNPDEQPYSESNLDSPEYRQRLMRKLNTLIAVLEVACAKVRQSLAGPDPDVDRLTRIHKNLSETLKVCKRAKTALENREKLPDDLPANLTQLTMRAREEPNDKPATGFHVEMVSADEAKKFEQLGPIDPKEIRSVDLDDLARQLGGA